MIKKDAEKISLIRSKCPICGKTTDLQYRPFCSKRCADVDLNRWFSGSYRFESEEIPDTIETLED